ncbi:MAG: DUF1552 domain-containing protein [Myxococcota bacterium]|nr:DUF1552 domain-containing protein [Myxococcota bacterium]
MSIYSRRKLFKGFGGALLAPSFYRLLSQPAFAQESTLPKRLLVFFTPNGTIPHRLWPTGTETAFSFASDGIWAPLSSITSDIIILKGLNFHNADNHEGGMAAMLTNNGGLGTETNNQSLDQVIAASIGASYKFRSLELGVQTSAWGGNSQTRMSYAGPGQYVTPDDSPESVYMRLFGDLLLSDSEASKRRVRQQKVIDIAHQELVDLYGRLGAEERIKLQQHLDALNDLENRLYDVGICTPMDEPPALSHYENDQFPMVAQAQIDLAVTALACEHTPVVSLQLSHTVGPTVFSWLGISDGHHSLSHTDNSNLAGVNDYVAAEQWYAERFVDVIEALRTRPNPEGDGTLLDDTVVLWAQEMGDGRAHVCTDVPFVLAGGGPWQKGRFLDTGGINHCHLLTEICNGFGLGNQTFGDPSAGTGGLDIL